MREAQPCQGLITAECAANKTTRDILVASEEQSIVAFDLSAAEPRYLAISFQKFIKEKSKTLKAYRKKLYRARLKKWAHLIILMKDSQTPFEGTLKTSSYPTYTEDPLWAVFKYPERGDCGGDPYNAFLIAMAPDGYNNVVANSAQRDWLKDNRWKGKLGFLALAYGSTAKSLAPKIGWPVDRMREALTGLEESCPTLDYLREDTLLQILHTGQVRSLYGRPRRINGYFHLLNTLGPVNVGFHRRACDCRRDYEAEVIVLGSLRQGVQIFLKKCWIEEAADLRLPGNDYVFQQVHNGRVDHYNKDKIQYLIKYHWHPLHPPEERHGLGIHRIRHCMAVAARQQGASQI